MLRERVRKQFFGGEIMLERITLIAMAAAARGTTDKPLLLAHLFQTP